MNWAGTQKGEGFEYHLLALAITFLIMARGAGAFSLDRVLSRRSSSEPGTRPLARAV
jgi:putative oxidoreductase